MATRSHRRFDLAPANTFAMPADIRAYAIGDIHGRVDALASMLEIILENAAAQSDRRKTKLIFLGDYIDRGDHASEVMAMIRTLSKGSETSVIPLKGNHEAALVDFVRDPVARRDWLSFGGRQTLASYGIKVPLGRDDPDTLFELRNAAMKALGDDLAYMEGLATHYELGDVLFTHAGCNPAIGQGLTDKHAMIWGSDEGLVDRPLAGRLVVHGHYEAAAPVHRPGRICIDTGAYYTGRLTALRLDDRIGFLST